MREKGLDGQALAGRYDYLSMPLIYMPDSPSTFSEIVRKYPKQILVVALDMGRK